MGDSPTKEVVVSASRIERLIGALAAASLEKLEQALQLQVQGEDAFSALESTFVVFVSDLNEAKAKLEKALVDMEASRNELAAKLVTIEEQRVTIRELSNPILDVWDGIVMLPVVGALDTERAAEMNERLLERIVETRARAVIIDITGVEVVDTATADHLVRLARASKMLGAECVLTGIGPNIASMLVSIGADLGGVRTLRTLRDGLRACLETAPEAERRDAGHRGSRRERGRLPEMGNGG